MWAVFKYLPLHLFEIGLKGQKAWQIAAGMMRKTVGWVIKWISVQLSLVSLGTRLKAR